MAANNKDSFLDRVNRGIELVLNPPKRVTPKLQKDPNTNIRATEKQKATTTLQDAQGDSYLAPEGLEELPNVVKGGQPVTRKQVAQYMSDRELDAMPSNMGVARTKALLNSQNLPSNVDEMVAEYADIKSKESVNKQLEKIRAAKAAEEASKSGTKTRETMPRIGDPLRSISLGRTSIYDTMPLGGGATEEKAPESSGPPSNNMMNKIVGSQPDRTQAPSAMSEDRFQSLYKTATGTSFNPKSKADKAARREIEAVLSSRPELADASDVKIALAWYANKRNKK